MMGVLCVRACDPQMQRLLAEVAFMRVCFLIQSSINQGLNAGL